MQIAGKDHARNSVRKKSLIPIHSLSLRQRFQKIGFRIPDHLHAFESKITGEPGEDQSGPIDGRLANGALEAAGSGNAMELQVAGMAGIKPFYCYQIALHGSYRLNSGPRYISRALGSFTNC